MRTSRGLFPSLLLALVSCLPEPPLTPEPPPPPPRADAMPMTPVGSTQAPTSPPVASSAAPIAPATAEIKKLALPGVTGAASLDYIAYERAANRVWIPVGNTGSADVLDVATGTFMRVDGFATAEREVRGKKRTMGPSAVSIGEGFAYVGNRATNEVCPVDLATLKPSPCLKLSSPTDGVAYVASAKEVWVTTPRAKTIAVLDASKPGALKAKTTIATAGEPEGYAVDDARGLFFTNLEDKDLTLAIDIKTHAVKSTWKAGCGSEGPRGVAVDGAKKVVIVACTDGVRTLDSAHDGAPLAKLDTGAGVDNLDYDATTGTLWIGAGKAAKLVVAKVDALGALTVVGTRDTSEGARNAVADKDGNAYLADGPGGRVLVVPAVK